MQIWIRNIDLRLVYFLNWKHKLRVSPYYLPFWSYEPTYNTGSHENRHLNTFPGSNVKSTLICRRNKTLTKKSNEQTNNTIQLTILDKNQEPWFSRFLGTSGNKFLPLLFELKVNKAPLKQEVECIWLFADLVVCFSCDVHCWLSLFSQTHPHKQVWSMGCDYRPSNFSS